MPARGALMNYRRESQTATRHQRTEAPALHENHCARRICRQKIGDLRELPRLTRIHSVAIALLKYRELVGPIREQPPVLNRHQAANHDRSTPAPGISKEQSRGWHQQ